LTTEELIVVEKSQNHWDKKLIYKKTNFINCGVTDYCQLWTSEDRKYLHK